MRECGKATAFACHYLPPERPGCKLVTCLEGAHHAASQTTCLQNQTAKPARRARARCPVLSSESHVWTTCLELLGPSRHPIQRVMQAGRCKLPPRSTTDRPGYYHLPRSGTCMRCKELPALVCLLVVRRALQMLAEDTSPSKCSFIPAPLNFVLSFTTLAVHSSRPIWPCQHAIPDRTAPKQFRGTTRKSYSPLEHLP